MSAQSNLNTSSKLISNTIGLQNVSVLICRYDNINTFIDAFIVTFEQI